MGAIRLCGNCFCWIQCAPSPTTAFDRAFWPNPSAHPRRLILCRGGIRRAVPKGFPFFHVEWDDGGYAQIIEGEVRTRESRVRCRARPQGSALIARGVSSRMKCRSSLGAKNSFPPEKLVCFSDPPAAFSWVVFYQLPARYEPNG